MKEINDINQYAGRGRPRVENPLTQAERAKAYRDRKRADNMVKSDAVTVTEILVKCDDIKTVTEILETVPKKLYDELVRVEEHRTMALGSAHSEIRALTAQIVALQAQIAKPKRAKK